MKTKKFGKKLVLNKKTVAHLGSGELNAAKGGVSGISCPPFPQLPLPPTCISCPTGDPCEYCPIFKTG
jgi:hypothetical protein